MRNDPVVEQAAEKVNDTINNYTDHNARFVPENDAMPILKDLGYGGSRATMLFGSGKTEALAIKGLLLEGYRTLPDCSYTDFGVNTQINQSKGVILVIVVLAA